VSYKFTISELLWYVLLWNFVTILVTLYNVLDSNTKEISKKVNL